jgi:hypothetical protein
MKRTLIVITSGLAVAGAALAQTPPDMAPMQAIAQSLLQQVDTLTVGAGGGAVLRTFGASAETGKPYSATVTTQTRQTYLDGTQVNHSTTTLQYRDADGRVRTETESAGRGGGEPVRHIVIRDPVSKSSYRLDPATKTAIKMMMAGAAVAPAAGGGRGGGGGVGGLRGGSVSQPEAVRSRPNQTVEDLGAMTVNGVAARGTRITTVVPAGAIGNDRDFRSVEERWFSPELNLLIKSVTEDPRFGTTIYEMTNISRVAPDPSLFRVPSEYTITSNGPREPQF